MVGFGSPPTYRYTVVMWLTGQPSPTDAEELASAGWQVHELYATRDLAAWSGPDAVERASAAIPVLHRALFGDVVQVRPRD